MTSAIAMILTAALIVSPVAATRAAAAPRAPAVGTTLLEAAETAAANGAWRAQNTPRITTGTIRDDDKRRSALAFAISGAGAFIGAFLWRWLPCRGQDAHDFVDQYEGFRQWQDAQCYDEDGSRLGWDTPTKALFGAGIALELVSLGYLFAHMRGQNDDDSANASAAQQP